MVIFPPSGMASRALTTRLTTAFSSWLPSTNVGQRPPPEWSRSRPSLPPCGSASPRQAADEAVEVDLLRAQDLLAGECEQTLRQRCGSPRALHRRRDRLADCRVAVPARSQPALGRVEVLPMTTVIRLLKSWATPPASWPIDFIFSRLRQRGLGILTRVSSASASVRSRNSRMRAAAIEDTARAAPTAPPRPTRMRPSMIVRPVHWRLAACRGDRSLHC